MALFFSWLESYKPYAPAEDLSQLVWPPLPPVEGDSWGAKWLLPSNQNRIYLAENPAACPPCKSKVERESIYLHVYRLVCVELCCACGPQINQKLMEVFQAYAEEVRHCHMHCALMNISRTKKPSIQQSGTLCGKDHDGFRGFSWCCAESILGRSSLIPRLIHRY